jgi:HEXXH motif-containing protein
VYGGAVMQVGEAAAAAWGTWTPDEVRARLAAWWAPAALTAFAAAVRRVAALAPEIARRHRVVPLARRVLGASPEARVALAADPALGRWSAAIAETAPGPGLEPVVALLPRLAGAATLLDGGDLDAVVVVGSGGRARIPVFGAVLQGPPGRAIRAEVRAGALRTHSRQARQVGAFEVPDGHAEGGKLPAVRPLSGRAATDAAARLADGVAALRDTAPGRLAEIEALSPVLVPVASQPGVSHSCSMKDARGCIWLSAPDRPLVIAETLVHEASHLKFYLIEDDTPFTAPDDPPRFEVPWRPDLRPLRAVLMGLHAWETVLAWLGTIEDGAPWSQPAAQRRPLLEEAVAAAREIVAGADGLSAAGQALLSWTPAATAATARAPRRPR